MVLSVITVTWNSSAYIEKQIQAVRRMCAGLAYEHIVVDNGSTDNTPHIVREDSTVRFIQNSENKGFAAANNQGLLVSSGEYVLFLNPDMLPNQGMAQNLIAYMKVHTGSAIAAPVLKNNNGTFNANAKPRRFPRIIDLFLLISKLPHFFPFLLNRYYYSDKDFLKSEQVESVRGSCMLVTRNFINECGFGFDPRYFFWFEDVDLCKEAYVRGYTVDIVQDAACVDFVGQSVKKRNSVWKQFQFASSMLVYIRKWFPFKKRFFLEICLVVYIWALSFFVSKNK